MSGLQPKTAYLAASTTALTPGSSTTFLVSSRVVDMVVEVSPMAMVLLVSTAVDGMVETTEATTPTDA